MNIQTREALLVSKINSLKKQKNVTILAHYYMPPLLQLLEKDGGIADITGDSLGLSLAAQQTTSAAILFCGVRFMAETALLINPTKKVYMPDRTAGCSLAASITAEDIHELRKQYPGVPVMGYINTNAETKTALDICCTSRNAMTIAQSLDSDTILFVPDLYMGQNLQTAIAKACGKKLILWKGTCDVHEQFKSNLSEIANDTEVLMHWEVPQETVTKHFSTHKGIVGSTGDILSYVKQSSAKTFYLASECDLGVALKQQNSDKEFITPCIRCPYMKQNTLENVLLALEAIGTAEETDYSITLDEETITQARIPVLKMLQYNA